MLLYEAIPSMITEYGDCFMKQPESNCTQYGAQFINHLEHPIPQSNFFTITKVLHRTHFSLQCVFYADVFIGWITKASGLF